MAKDTAKKKTGTTRPKLNNEIISQIVSYSPDQFLSGADAEAYADALKQKERIANMDWSGTGGTELRMQYLEVDDRISAYETLAARSFAEQYSGPMAEMKPAFIEVTKNTIVNIRESLLAVLKKEGVSESEARTWTGGTIQAWLMTNDGPETIAQDYYRSCFSDDELFESILRATMHIRTVVLRNDDKEESESRQLIVIAKTLMSRKWDVIAPTVEGSRTGIVRADPRYTRDYLAVSSPVHKALPEVLRNPKEIKRVNTGGNGKHHTVTTLTHAPGVKTSIEIKGFPLVVLDALFSIWVDQGPDAVFTVPTVWRTIADPSRDPSERMRERITDVLEILRGVGVSISAGPELARKGADAGIASMLVKTYIAPMEYARIEMASGQVIDGWRFIGNGWYFQYLQAIGQFAVIPPDVRAIPNVSMTEQRIEIVAYLIRHVEACKKDPWQHTTIIIDTLLDSLELPTDGTHRNRVVKFITEDVFPHWKAIGYIDGFDPRKKGKRVEAVTFKVDQPKKIPGKKKGSVSKSRQ